MKKYFLIFLGILAVLLTIAIWYGFSKTTQTTVSNDPNRPVVEISENSYSLGQMKVSEKKSHDFTIKNSGQSELVVKQFTTSCGCTYANVIKDGVESPKFSMHINSDWQTTIEPGKAITLRVVYDPSAMPVEGYVERFVSFATNDPEKPAVQLKLTAEVSK